MRYTVMKAGAPTKYNPEIGAKICEEIANTTKGIRAIAAKHGIAPSTIFLWLTIHKEFSEQYYIAKQIQAELFVDEMIEIADETSNDTLQDQKTGNEYPNNEWINRSKLRCDVRKFIASKLLPKKYGDKIDLTSGNEAISIKVDFKQ